MVARGSFVPVLVVASDASHQLLRLRIKALSEFVCELACVPSAKRCSNSTMMQDLNVPVLALPMREPEISFERLVHRDLTVD
jgi:hypothetical protein